jgi:type IV pilus assembly protein PilC
MKFIYQARTKEGDLKSGIIEASSKEVAISLLQKFGYYVTFLEEEKPSIYTREIRIFGGISFRDLFIFFRQFSILLQSQVPIVESLTTLSAQIKNLKLKEIISDIAKEVDAGSSLSKAFSKYPKIFSSFYIAMVKAGEASGKLPQSLSYLADHLEREYTLRGKIRGAMMYPALVFFVFIIIFTMMIFWIFPQFEEALIEREVEIPLLTKIILSFSKFLRENFLILILIFGALLIFILYYLRTEEGKKLFDRISLKIPLLGEILKQSLISRFAGNLSLLTSAGLSITETLEIVEEIVGNEVYKLAISKMKEGVKRGESISSISSFYPEIFPPLFTQMTLVGEKTGALSRCFLTISNFYRSEVEKSIDNFLTILEPLLIIILAGLVGILMFSVFLPLYRVIGTY